MYRVDGLIGRLLFLGLQKSTSLSPEGGAESTSADALRTTLNTGSALSMRRRRDSFGQAGTEGIGGLCAALSIVRGGLVRFA